MASGRVPKTDTTFNMSLLRYIKIARILLKIVRLFSMLSLVSFSNICNY